MRLEKTENRIRKISKVPGYVGAYIKLLFAYMWSRTFFRALSHNNMWIIGEKKTEARDNGYQFYRYVAMKYPKQKVYYVIKEGSVDAARIDKENLLYYNSLKHCIFYLCAKCLISGQSHFNIPFSEYGHIRGKFTKKDQRRIFIGHGIKKDCIDEIYDYRKSKYSLMTTGVSVEYEYYIKKYNIPEKRIALTGLCRYDKLYGSVGIENTRQQILIMPTFRAWLQTDDSSKKTPNEKEIKRFIESDFFKRYSELINDELLIETCKSNNLKVVFYLHYTFQPFTECFRKVLKEQNRDTVFIMGREEADVQSLLIESKMLITDYSSVFFDFAFMKKPVVYYQFDKEEYRKRHYQKGWFSYSSDGFGPICTRREETVEFVEETISEGFKICDDYYERIKDFFDYTDDKNCERVYRAILSLE